MDVFTGTSAHLEDVITAAGTAVDKARAAEVWWDNAKSELRKNRGVQSRVEAKEAASALTITYASSCAVTAALLPVPPERDTVTDFLSSIPPRTPGAIMAALYIEVSEADVLKSVWRCKCGKAWSPDELGNDWYRDNEDSLVPLLVRLFNVCVLSDILPSTFGKAVVACIKKSKSAARPLDYRQISLLKSD
ncbi:unnamed protein product [Hyaloperonospora brassicae]|uniref:RxLR effector candidate protein n=1 Tax=Hyaloperonospora brassicae TaxID=162125 RepID=A0AAV0V0V2_HYABA|nr:unnamed protein product [Hyaloperonospora brassicae]